MLIFYFGPSFIACKKRGSASTYTCELMAFGAHDFKE